MKLMIVLDEVRPSYLDNEGKFIFLQTRVAKQLIKLLTAPRAGLGLKYEDVAIEFAYDKVPPINGSGKLKDVSISMGKASFTKLHNKIVAGKPDLVIPMGNTALLGVTGRKGINKLRGILDEKTFVNEDNEDFKTWVLPTHSLDSVGIMPEHKSQIVNDFKLAKKFLNEGIKAFDSGVGKYELVTDFNRVKEIFTNILVKKLYQIVAVDFETNTLHGEYKDVPDKNGTGKIVSAKPIILSMSWKEGQGVCIPLDHKKAPWTPEQLQEIYKLLKVLFMSDQWKVLHNGKFDTTFLMETIGLKYTKHCVDTMMMFFVGVSEEPNVRKDLKSLAYQYTTMGGYDHDLDDYKKNFIEERYNQWQERMEKRKIETGEKYYKKDYQPLVNEVDGGNFNYEWIPLDIMYKYAAGDTDACLRIYHALLPTIQENKKWVNLIFNFYPNLQDALAEAESNGMHMNGVRAYHLKEAYSKELKRIVDAMYKEVPEIKEYEGLKSSWAEKYHEFMKIKPKEREPVLVAVAKQDFPQLVKKSDADTAKQLLGFLRKYTGTDSHGNPRTKFNPNSNEDTKYILYYMLGYTLPYDQDYLVASVVEDKVPEDQITWKDYKADVKAALPYLKETYHEPLADLLIQYSKIDKLLGSFIEKLPPLRDVNGCIHTRYNMAGTVTSRLSSSGNYNQQQVPRRDADPTHFAYHYPIKSMFTSRFKDGLMLNIDFKTLEIFIAAMTSQDEGMAQLLLDGADFHSATARKVFDIPEDEPVPKNERSKAKAASFGVLYGISATGLSANENIPVDEAQEIIDQFLNAYPKLQQAIDDAHESAEHKGYVEMLSGFRRRLGSVHSKDKGKASRALRQAYNAIVQGSGAYCTNTALINLRHIFQAKHFKSLIVGTVHDSIVIDVHPSEVLQVAKICDYVFSHLNIPEVVNNDATRLKVPEKWQLPDNKFRFPLHGEVELGANYNDDVELIPDEFKKFKSAQGYCKFKYAQLQLEENKEAGTLTDSQYKLAQGKLKELKQTMIKEN